MKIMVFGNLLLEEDNLPLKLMPALKKEFPSIKFSEYDTVDEIHKTGKNMILIDSAKGIKKVCMIEDLDLIENKKIFTMHDFDLGYILKLMKKVKMLDSVKIFCVPTGMGEKTALSQLTKIIRSNLF